MKIIIQQSSMIPIYEQIIDQIKGKIINNKLQENEPLPSVRKLAKELGVSALTVKKAYDALEKEGLTVTVHGKGSFVAAINLELEKEYREKEIQEELETTIKKAKTFGISDEDLHKLFIILLED